MSLKDVFQSSAEKIRSGILHNEAQVKMAVIVPILQALDWDPSNPAEFAVEMPTGDGFVDYALCDENKRPLAFIEAKRLGGANDSGEEQLFKYAYHQGIPFLILTDGNVWNFYLSTATGSRAERRFYHAELQRDERHEEYAKMFGKFLRKERVVAGNLKHEAEQLLESDRERAKTRQAIPVVWRNLLTTPHEELAYLLSKEVEGECGTKPEVDDVESFLQMRATFDSPQIASGGKVARPSSQPKTQPHSQKQPHDKKKKIVGFVFEGESREVGAANRVLAEVLKVFQNRDNTFLPRYAQQTVGRTRRLVAKTREGLYDVEGLSDYAVDLENGWWLGTNISMGVVRKNIITACEVAGVKYDSQLTLIER